MTRYPVDPATRRALTTAGLALALVAASVAVAVPTSAEPAVGRPVRSAGCPDAGAPSCPPTPAGDGPVPAPPAGPDPCQDPLLRRVLQLADRCAGSPPEPSEGWIWLGDGGPLRTRDRTMGLPPHLPTCAPPPDQVRKRPALDRLRDEDAVLVAEHPTGVLATRSTALSLVLKSCLRTPLAVTVHVRSRSPRTCAAGTPGTARDAVGAGPVRTAVLDPQDRGPGPAVHGDRARFDVPVTALQAGRCRLTAKARGIWDGGGPTVVGRADVDLSVREEPDRDVRLGGYDVGDDRDCADRWTERNPDAVVVRAGEAAVTADIRWDRLATCSGQSTAFGVLRVRGPGSTVGVQTIDAQPKGRATVQLAESLPAPADGARTYRYRVDGIDVGGLDWSCRTSVAAAVDGRAAATLALGGAISGPELVDVLSAARRGGIDCVDDVVDAQPGYTVEVHAVDDRDGDDGPAIDCRVCDRLPEPADREPVRSVLGAVPDETSDPRDLL